MQNRKKQMGNEGKGQESNERNMTSVENGGGGGGGGDKLKKKQQQNN